MDIRDKLARLDSASSPRQRDIPETGGGAAEEEWIARIQQELQLKVLQEEKSFILLKENYYPLYQDNLFLALRDRGFQADALTRISSDLPKTSWNLKHALFIDTETTGLAGGTGTYAFLIGIGHLELDHIVVRQYLLPDFSHEWLMLKHIEQALQSFQFTVSFNGKSFDIPLLKNRYILNRMLTVLEEIPHLDLLHAARRIWKIRLPACDLQSLERHILGIDRVGDIPGEMIPHIYFEFIRKRDALLLRDVLEHNFHDIVNMILLTVKIVAICETPLKHLQHREDLYSLAKYFYQTKRYRETTPLLEEAAANLSPSRDHFLNDAVFLLAMSYKKLGDSTAAKEHLNALLNRQVLHPLIIEELAKFYEHEDKDYTCAGEVVAKGLQYLEMTRQLEPHSELLGYLPRLRYRQQRIQRKKKAEEKNKA
jgi:uncharacterized protein YprB with RNaseH-like and TPR domain